MSNNITPPVVVEFLTPDTTPVSGPVQMSDEQFQGAFNYYDKI
jgi:hypothetical protein